MKHGLGIYRRRVVDEQLVNTPKMWRPVIRRRMGYEIYYRWSWWAIFDRKIKTIWFNKYKDIPIYETTI